MKIKIITANWEIDKKELITLRTEVFVNEQNVPSEEELDNLDSDCMHVLALDEKGKSIGTCRMLPNHSIGRMCVLSPYRGSGVGSKMLTHFIGYAKTNAISKLTLSAQVHAIPFYEKFDFIVDSEVYLDANISHQHMTLSI